MCMTCNRLTKLLQVLERLAIRSRGFWAGLFRNYLQTKQNPWLKLRNTPWNRALEWFWWSKPSPISNRKTRPSKGTKCWFWCAESTLDRSASSSRRTRSGNRSCPSAPSSPSTCPGIPSHKSIKVSLLWSTKSQRRRNWRSNRWTGWWSEGGTSR